MSTCGTLVGHFDNTNAVLLTQMLLLLFSLKIFLIVSSIIKKTSLQVKKKIVKFSHIILSNNKLKNMFVSREHLVLLLLLTAVSTRSVIIMKWKFIIIK